MRIGITSTIPGEIIFAAGNILCDLNNIFITSPDPGHFIEIAESRGFPRTTCAWIKGIYGVLQEKKIDTVIVVSGGDCSNSIALGEVLDDDGLHVIAFSYPAQPDPAQMTIALNRLAAEFGVSASATATSKMRFDEIRRNLAELDRLTWRENRVSGQDNFSWLVSASDFNQDPESYQRELKTFLRQAATAPPRRPALRLGLIGVPPILTNLFAILEELDAEVVFNEIPRQFAMPWAPESSLAEQYCRYTYPYAAHFRLKDIMRACEERQLDGLIHYTQSFCFRQIEDIIFRRGLPLPILTLEADQPETIDGRTLTRLETFLEMLRQNKALP